MLLLMPYLFKVHMAVVHLESVKRVVSENSAFLDMNVGHDRHLFSFRWCG